MKAAATAICLVAIAVMTTTSAEQTPPVTKPRILVHLTSGPENPTKAALAFLVARTAVEQGHAVSMFLAGDAVQLLRETTLDGVSGVGTGKLREHFDIIVKGGGRFYLSGMSSAARGITAAELLGKPAELAPPAILLKLALDNDRMFTY
jgi:predicted peroxiredoxin